MVIIIHKKFCDTKLCACGAWHTLCAICGYYTINSVDEVHDSGDSREKGLAFFNFMIQCSHISRASGTKAPNGALQTALLFACEVIIPHCFAECNEFSWKFLANF